MMMRPETEADLSDVIRSTDEPLAIRGGGSHGIAVEGALLETAGMSGISLYEPGALTLVASAGTPVAEIAATLDAEGQMLAFEPMDMRGLTGQDGAPTIGGVVAGNLSGPRRVSAGACRDFLLGVRFVDGLGKAIKNGGRVMKNVTGYDLVKLMAGSWGTLGVLTEVSLKVLPKPETGAVVRLEGLPVDEAVGVMSAALGSPFDVNGAAHLPGREPVTVLRIEGNAPSVAYRAKALRDRLRPFGAAEIADDLGVWPAIRDAALFCGTDDDVWRVSLKPSDAAEFSDAVLENWPEAQMQFDWGGGLVWVGLPQGSDLRTIPFHGHATRMRGNTGALPRFHPEPAPVAKIASGLRQRFDPKSILNKGLMG